MLVAHAELDYLAPARIGDVLVVGCRIAWFGSKSLRFDLAVWDETTQAAVVRGHEIYVTVDATTFRPKPVPEFFKEAVDRLQGPVGSASD